MILLFLFPDVNFIACTLNKVPTCPIGDFSRTICLHNTSLVNHKNMVDQSAIVQGPAILSFQPIMLHFFQISLNECAYIYCNDLALRNWLESPLVGQSKPCCTITVFVGVMVTKKTENLLCDHIHTT